MNRLALLLFLVVVGAGCVQSRDRKEPFPVNLGSKPSCTDWLWPMPTIVNCSTGSKVYFAKDFKINFVNDSKAQGSAILKTALEQFQANAFQPPELIERGTGTEPEVSSEAPSPTTINQLTLFVRDDNVGDKGKALGDDESYALDVTDSGASIHANTVWGALYALTTFEQLIVLGTDGAATIVGGPVSVYDTPRYPWRGLLIDSVNHFLPVSDILRTVATMAKNKMNVLHWHLTDSYSFPFESQRFPELSASGAWHKNAVYTHGDVSQVESYARYRGVRVVLEVDQPGHAYSWGLGKPGITIPCPSVEKDIGPINVVPFDPTNDETYATITGILEELAALVPGEHFHLGGDELQYGCWNASVHVKKWMAKEGIPSWEGVTQHFFSRIRKVSEQTLGRLAVVWEDLFFDTKGNINFNSSTVPFPPGKAIIEVWTSPEFLSKATQAGYDAILAYGWYLDRQVPVDNETSWFWEDTWRFMYLNDPENIDPAISSATYEMVNSGAVLGGEASMWSEQVDPTVLDGRIWPRACAVAERLWSPKSLRDVQAASARLNRHRCRLKGSTGIQAGPIWAGYCAPSYS